jgi:hypothetical protein
MTLKIVTSLIAMVLSLWTVPVLEAQFYTTPGNATSISVIVDNTETGRPCQGCTVQWYTQGIQQNSGSHFHPNANGPRGLIYSQSTVTDVTGHATAQFTTATTTVAGTPRGYAGVFGLQICSPQAQAPACVIATITATYTGLTQAASTPGLLFGTDAAHNNLGRALTNFMNTELTYIGSLYWAMSGHGQFYVLRCSLPTGGIYDALQVGAYWALTDTDDHMWGTGFDVLQPTTKALMTDFLDAVGETPGFSGGSCTTVSFSTWTHIMCGQGPQM